MSKDIKTRIYRSRVGTTLFWNTDALSLEQRQNWVLQARLDGEEAWFRPRVTTPPQGGALGNIMDERTSAIMIPHHVAGRINEGTKFEAKITFGVQPDIKEVTVQVAPQDGHMPYVKPHRIQLAANKVVYAEPIYVAGIAPDVIQQIVNALAVRMKESVSQ